MRKASHRSLQHLVLLAVVLSGGTASLAQTPPGDAGQVPWFIELGRRVAAVRERMPTENRVVLVPDEATFLDEISRWKAGRSVLDKSSATAAAKGCWPVLIEDDVYTPMFIRAFRPAKVVRRTEKAPPLTDADAVRAAIRRSVLLPWFAEPDTAGDYRSAFARQDHTPAGVVVFSAGDATFVAAAALAAAEGLIPVEVQGDFGTPGSVMDQATFGRLDAAIRDGFTATGVDYRRLGDPLDAAAVCLNMAQRAKLDLPPSRRPSIPGMPAVSPEDPSAVSDALARNDDGSRYAICGTIFGTPTRAAYMAMCSVFLPRQDVWCFDSYANAPPQFEPYRFTQVQPLFTRSGFRARTLQASEAGLAGWRTLLMTGFECDALFLNSSGNADFFDLGPPGATAPSDSAGPGDVPVLSRPLALSMVHSWSLMAPDDRETVGGRWLDSGVYAYVGSVHEPYLSGFYPPPRQIVRMMDLTPFLVAARQFDGEPFAATWRIATIGDPLMLCAAPEAWRPPDRLSPTPLLPGEEDAVAGCIEALGRSKGDSDGAATLEAMHRLARLGKDAEVASLWRLAAGRPWSVRVASAALDSLFVRREADAFLEAYARTPTPTSRQRDMLWQLWGPRLSQLQDPSRLELFASSVRRTWPSKDWERLRGPYAAALGGTKAKAEILRCAEGVTNRQQREALQALARD